MAPERDAITEMIEQAEANLYLHHARRRAAACDGRRPLALWRPDRSTRGPSAWQAQDDARERHRQPAGTAAQLSAREYAIHPGLLGAQLQELHLHGPCGGARPPPDAEPADLRQPAGAVVSRLRRSGRGETCGRPLARAPRPRPPSIRPSATHRPRWSRRRNTPGRGRNGRSAHPRRRSSGRRSRRRAFWRSTSFGRPGSSTEEEEECGGGSCRRRGKWRTVAFCQGGAVRPGQGGKGMCLMPSLLLSLPRASRPWGGR